MKRKRLFAAAFLVVAFLAASACVWRFGAWFAPSPSLVESGLPTPQSRIPGESIRQSEDDVALVAAKEPAEGDCMAALAKLEGSSRLTAEQRRLHIESSLDEQGTPLERDLVADLAGYRRESGNVLDNGLPTSLFLSYGTPPLPPNTRDLSFAEQLRFDKLLKTEGIEGLLALDAAVFQTAWGTVTFAGHLIREHDDALDALLSRGHGLIPLGLHELAIAVESGAAFDDFSMLLDAARVDPTETWWNGANLAKLAAIHGRPDILRLLMSYGVDPTTPRRKGHGSLLDDIVLHVKPPRGEAFAAVVEQLVAAGERPFLPSTLTALEQWLPGTTLPALHPNSETALRSPALQERVASVAALDADWKQRLDAATRLEQRCERFAAKIEQPGDALRNTPRNTSLAAKQRYQEALEKHIRQESDAVLGDRNEPPDADAMRLIEQLQQLVAEKRWDEAIALGDQVGNNLHFILLHIALGSDAPLEILLALVDRHGGLPMDAATTLAHNRRPDAVQIAQALEPYGLNIHYVDMLGRNAFSILAGYRDWEKDSTRRFAEYLASRFVAIKPSVWGLDPLDQALTNLLRYRYSNRSLMLFVRFAIDYGAPVESSHLQLAQSISMANPDTYRRLVSIAPELIS